MSGTNPTGTLIICVGTTEIGRVPVSGGTATFTTSALTEGDHALVASYSGDANNTRAPRHRSA